MTKKITIAIDAMGGDNSPDKTIEGISIFLKHNKKKDDFLLNLFGDETKIKKKLEKYKISTNHIVITHTDSVVSDAETPLTAIKSSKNTSMWNCIKSQIEGNSDISLSAGNTGVLLVISRMILKMVDKVSKPALAGFWPNKNGVNVVLDLGANIECDDQNLVDFAELGSALYKSLFPNDISKVSLLNVGSEEIKGTDTLKSAFKKLKNLSGDKNFIFQGYSEGNTIMNGNSNVIVTDGFTGNIALKTAEGTANFITSELKKAMTGNFIGKFSSLLNISNLRKFKKRLDPRLYNGAIFIGLDSPVIKSHGGTDYIGFSNSLSVCTRIVSGNLIEKIRNNIN